MKRSASHRAKSVTAAAPRGAVKAAALTRAETAGASSKYFRLSCKSRGALGRHAARSAPWWRRARNCRSPSDVCALVLRLRTTTR